MRLCDLRFALRLELFLTLIAFLATCPLDAQTAPVKTMFPPVRTMHEMAGGGNNFVVQAALRILAQGGNAVDAGVAATLVAAVTEEDHFSMGGEAPILIKLTGKPAKVISGIGTAPMKATIEFFNNRPPEPWESPERRAPIPAMGVLATTSPGMVDGVLLALENYGTLSFEKVAQPAIEAADGFPVTEIFAQTLQQSEPMIRRWPESVSFFFGDGKVPQRGDVFRQPTLAKTLRDMVDAERKAKGSRVRRIDAVRDYFYRGPVAKKIGAFSEALGGLLTYSDIAAFRAEIDEPRTTMYRGYEIVKPGFFTQGPVLLEMLNLLEGYDLKKLGHNSPEYLHTLVEAAKLGFADRDAYYGDPKFSKIPEATLLSKDYASARRKLIDPEHASMESRPGEIGVSRSMPSGKGVNLGVEDTTCVNVIDRMGNVFSATEGSRCFRASVRTRLSA